MSSEDLVLHSGDSCVDAAVETCPAAVNPMDVPTLCPEVLIAEAQQLILKDDSDPDKMVGLKQSLNSLVSLLTAGLSSSGLDSAEILPTILSQLPESLQDAGRSLLLNPDEFCVVEPTNEWIDDEKKLSDSALWRLQEEYYSSLGIEAWNNVPFFVTSSTFIAENYADMIICFLRDYIDKLDLDEPVYIVEMATGSGRFSYYLLKELMKKKAYFAALKDVKIKYVMTDFTEKNILFWENHEKFKPFIESGVLDFAIFRPEEYLFLNLRNSKGKISNKTVKNPMMAIANYFFDSIRQDAFRIDEGVLKEGKISLWRNFNEDVRPSDPVRIGQISYCFNYYETDPCYYKDERLNSILNYYCENFFKASIIFPLGALDCVRNLMHMSNNNLVLISSDKGFTDMEYMLGHRDSEYATHDGAFSYMVNYHAIRKYFENMGGTSFFTKDKNLDLNTQMSILTRDCCELEELTYCFNEKVERCNDINFMYATQHLIDDTARENTYLRLTGLMGFLRMNLCDPAVFCRFASKMFESLDNISFVQKVDLLRVLDETWDNYYHFGGEANLPFWIAQVLYGLNMHEKSLKFFDKTVELHGEHEIIYYFRGKCHEALNKPCLARECFVKSLELNPEFAPARESLADVEIVLNERKAISNILEL